MSRSINMGTLDDGYTLVRGHDATSVSDQASLLHFHNLWSDGDGSRFQVLGLFVFNFNTGEQKLETVQVWCLGA